LVRQGASHHCVEDQRRILEDSGNATQGFGFGIVMGALHVGRWWRDPCIPTAMTGLVASLSSHPRCHMQRWRHPCAALVGRGGDQWTMRFVVGETLPPRAGSAMLPDVVIRAVLRALISSGDTLLCGADISVVGLLLCALVANRRAQPSWPRASSS
jgi:hypothetical protein